MDSVLETFKLGEGKEKKCGIEGIAGIYINKTAFEVEFVLLTRVLHKLVDTATPRSVSNVRKYAPRRKTKYFPVTQSTREKEYVGVF
jgi:hypothetical protein